MRPFSNFRSRFFYFAGVPNAVSHTDLCQPFFKCVCAIFFGVNRLGNPLGHLGFGRGIGRKGKLRDTGHVSVLNTGRMRCWGIRPAIRLQKKYIKKFFIINYIYSVMAERVGFEPTRRYNRLLELQSSAFVHSATSPVPR